jgi:hypothetical protein
MRRSMIVVVGLAALACAAVLTIYLNPLRSFSLCREQTIMEKTSPDGRYVAVLMQRNCGAIEGLSAHINLRLASSPPFPKHLFGGTVNDGEVFDTARDKGDRFCWSSPNRLEIDYLRGDPNHWKDVWQDVSLGDKYLSCQ